jgi:hypothetical protein
LVSLAFAVSNVVFTLVTLIEDYMLTFVNCLKWSLISFQVMLLLLYLVLYICIITVTL